MPQEEGPVLDYQPPIRHKRRVGFLASHPFAKAWLLALALIGTGLTVSDTGWPLAPWIGLLLIGLGVAVFLGDILRARWEAARRRD